MSDFPWSGNTQSQETFLAPFGNVLQHFQKRRRIQKIKQSTTFKTLARRKRKADNLCQLSINCDTI